METYAILRRHGWHTPQDLEEAAGRSSTVLDGPLVDDIRWIRSYVFEEPGGGLGTICVYQATGEDAIRRHSDLARVPADEILRVVDTILVRPDPAPVAA